MIPWAGLFQRRCCARREPRGKGSFFGRCELRRGHTGDHVLDRGFDLPRWSTDWSDWTRSPRWPTGGDE